MESQGDVYLDWDPISDDSAFSEPVPTTMSGGCELEQETPAVGKLPSEDTMAESQFGDTGANTVKGPDTSTPIKKSLPSESEMANLDLVPSVTLPPVDNTIPVFASQHLTHYDLSGSSINIISNSQISDAQLSLVSAPSNGSVKGPQDHSKVVELPNRLSLLFSQACLRCAKCLDEEGSLDELKLLLQCWSSSDTTEMLLPDAKAAKSVVQLFQKATEKPLWHWLDFENLIQLIDLVGCETAKGILNDYAKQLTQFCEKQLHDLLPYKESPTPPTATTWMDVKWKGDKKKFKLGYLYRCKEFLVDYLKIPSSAFVFYELFPGCVTLRWVVLTDSACATIEAKPLTKCIQFLDAEMEIKLVRPVKCLKQKVSSVLKDVCDTDEYLFFGNTEYVFSQRVPQYAQCPICLGILQDAVVTNCCHTAFCLDCCEKASKTSPRCPICRREGFQYARDEFIDKQVVGNILAKCCLCKWEGYLWNALSQESNSCLTCMKIPDKESQEETPEATEAIDKERQEEGTAMAAALPQAVSIESQDEFEEKGSLVSEKGPLLDMVQTLLSHLRALHACLNEEAMSSSGVPLSSTTPGTLCDAVDEFTVLLRDMEENILAAEGSIVSGQDGRLSVAGDAADEPQQCESGQEASEQQLGAAETAVIPTLGVTSPPADLWESESALMLTEEDVRLHACVTIETPTQSVQSTEQSAAQRTLVHEAVRITRLAARAGQVSLLQQLLTATGMNPDHASYAQESLLYIACQFGYIEMAQMLIALGASVVFQSPNGRSPLHGAAYSGSLPCLELLLQNDADISVSDLSGDTPLHTAAQQGHAAFAKMLLHLKPTSVSIRNVCGQSALHRASQGGFCEIIEILLKADAILDSVDNEGFTPLHIAVKAGNAKAVKILLESKADPNLTSTESGLAPLHSAARQTAGVQLIQLLHAAGADVAVRDQKGRSVLHHAIKSSSLEVVQAVVDIGCPIDDVAQETLGLRAARAEQQYRYVWMSDESVRKVDWQVRILHEDDVQSSDHGATPLHLAILAREVDFVQFLLSKGASVLKTTSTGCAAIHLAVRSGEASIVKEIITAGSSTVVKTHDGLSPLHLAAQLGHKDAAMELINAGCDKEQLTGGKQKSKAMTALLIAAMKHQTEMVRTLVEAGCNVQATTADGHNAIHLAVSAALHTTQEPCDACGRNHPRQYHTGYAHRHAYSRRHYTNFEACETITVLVRLGCDINAMDVDGLSPLDLAQKGYRYHTFEEDLDRGWYPRLDYSSHLDTTLRRLGALTGHEMRRKAALSQTLDHATKSAENMETRLASSRPMTAHLRSKIKMRQTPPLRLGARVPSSYDLARLVVPHVSHLWRDIGSNLNIAPDRLDEADTDCSGDALECCMKVFNYWLNGEGKGPKTWNTVLDVLHMLGRRTLAESVRHQLQVYGY